MSDTASVGYVMFGLLLIGGGATFNGVKSDKEPMNWWAFCPACLWFAPYAFQTWLGLVLR